MFFVLQTANVAADAKNCVYPNRTEITSGDIVIPVYIGGDMIDEIVVTAQQRMNLRSGGR